MPRESDAWLDALPLNLQHHKHVLGHLLREAARDPRLRLVVVGCSIGREQRTSSPTSTRTSESTKRAGRKWRPRSIAW
jgi:hypothetical protein